MENFIEISSKDNKVLKLASLLCASSKARNKEGLFLLEGIRICKDAAENNIIFDKLLVSENALKRYQSDVELLSKNANSRYVLSDKLFEKISDTKSPQGIIAMAKMPEKRVFADKSGRYIALENLQDPSNLGAVSRTAEALGVSGLVITGNSTDIYSPKALRASMGTLLRIPVFVCDNLIDFARENSLRTVACVVDKSAADIKDFSFSSGDMLLIGNEGNGLLPETAQNADCKITVKMTGMAESLNAAVAAAIVMWEMMK